MESDRIDGVIIFRKTRRIFCYYKESGSFLMDIEILEFNHAAGIRIDLRGYWRKSQKVLA